MPRIGRTPRYGEPRVQEAATPGVRAPSNAPIEAFGGGAAAQPFAALGNFAETQEKIALDEEAQAARYRLGEEKRAADQWEQDNLYNPEKGILSRMGKNAAGADKEALDSFDKFTKEREGGLNGKYQQAFRESMADRKLAILGIVQQHQKKQIAAWKDGEYQANLESSKERAAPLATLGHPGPFRGEVDFLKTQIRTRAAEEGWDDKVLERELLKHETDVHARVIEGLLSAQQGKRAAGYLKVASERMDPDIVRKLTPAVEDGSRLAQAQSVADEMWRAPPTSFAQIRALTEGIQDAELRKAVDGEAKRRLAEDEADVQDAQKRDFVTAFNEIQKTRDINMLSPLLVRSLSPEQQRSLRIEHDHLNSKKDRVTNEKAYTAIWMTPRAQMATWGEADLLKAKADLSATDYKKLVDTVSDLRNGKGEKYASQYGDEEMRLRAMGKAGFAGAKSSDTLADISKDDKKAAAFGLLKEAVENKLSAYYATHKKNADDDQKKKYVAEAALDLSREVVVKRYDVGIDWLDSDEKTRLGDLEDADIEDIDVPASFSEKMYGLAITSFLDKGTTLKEYKKRYRAQIGRAYVASLLGADDARLSDMSSGAKR